MGFFDTLFGRQSRQPAPRSAAIAKQRLVEVLVHDHFDLSPQAIESMRRDIIEIISRHLEIDPDKLQIDFRRGDRGERLIADIPVLRQRSRRRSRG
jgi:cell division topological specificity factor